MQATPPAGPPIEPNPFEPPRAVGGKPRRPAYRPLPLLGQIAGRLAVLLAGVIAFVGTCVPIGAASFASHAAGAENLFVLAWVVGAAAALLAGFGAFRLIFRSRWRRLPPDEVDR